MRLKGKYRNKNDKLKGKKVSWYVYTSRGASSCMTLSSMLTNLNSSFNFLKINSSTPPKQDPVKLQTSCSWKISWSDGIATVANSSAISTH